MPRYEHAGTKFWEINVDGTKYTTRFGKLGTTGQTRLKTFKTAAEAKADADKAIAGKRKEGFALAGNKATAAKTTAAKPPAKPASKTATKPATASTGNPALEAAIDADPYDETAYSVYADFLQHSGDPRGELIALQLANKQAAAKKLRTKHEDYFLGPLAPHQLAYDHTYEQVGKKRTVIRPEAFAWKYGFIHGLYLSHNHYAIEYAEPKYTFEGSLAKVLEMVLAHPSGRFLAEITFVFNNDPNENNLQDLIDILAKRAPPTIRKLHFGKYNFAGGHAAGMAGHDTEISWYSIGNLGKLWKRVPGLRHLITQGGSKASTQAGGVQLGTLDLPNLRHAEFRSGGLEKANARAIAKANIPNIERLDIWYGDDNYGGDATAKDVAALLARTDLPKLRHLGIMNTAFSDELPDLLANSKLVKQLTHLDLSMGTLTDEGAQELAAHKAAFAHLDVLDVSHNYLTTSKVTLKGCAKKVISRAQRDQEEYGDGEIADRYPAVGE
jgi:uncharacterized protein (TIGR02996 family)